MKNLHRLRRQKFIRTPLRLQEIVRGLRNNHNPNLHIRVVLYSPTRFAIYLNNSNWELGRYDRSYYFRRAYRGPEFSMDLIDQFEIRRPS